MRSVNMQWESILNNRGLITMVQALSYGNEVPVILALLGQETVAYIEGKSSSQLIECNTVWEMI
jgi:hypothetical protein